MSARGYSKEILHPFNHGFYGSPNPAEEFYDSEVVSFDEDDRRYEYRFDNESFSMDDQASVGETDYDVEADRVSVQEAQRVFVGHTSTDSINHSEDAWAFTPQYGTEEISFEESENLDDIEMVFIEDLIFTEVSDVTVAIKDTDAINILDDDRVYAEQDGSDGFTTSDSNYMPIVSTESSDDTAFAEQHEMSATGESTDSIGLLDSNKTMEAYFSGHETLSYIEKDTPIQYKISDDSFSVVDNELFYLAPHPHRLVLGGNVVMGQWVSGDNIDTDVSGWDNHATLNNVAYVRPLEVGGYHSLHFHSDSSFNIPLDYPLASYPPRFTVSMWFKAEIDGTLIESEGMWAIGVQNEDVVAEITDRFGTTAAGVLVDDIEYGRSYHLAVVFAGDINTAYAYLDGKPQGSFSIEGIKKIEADPDARIRLGRGPYARFDGEIDNIHILAGSVLPEEVASYYEKATRTQDYLESVQAQRPILILSYDASSEDQSAYFEPHDLAMTKFLVNDDNFAVNSYDWHPIIWTEEYFTGAKLDHTGYLSLDLKPPEEVEHEDFIPSIEFVVDDMADATGVIFEINFQGDDMFRARAEDGLLIVEEINALGIFWFIEIEASERMHCIINMDEEDVVIYVNGYVRASLTPQNRTPFESIRMLGDGTDPFTGIAGPIIMYEEPVHRFVITQHFDIAYGGNTAVQYTESSAVAVNDDNYEGLIHDWTMVPAS